MFVYQEGDILFLQGLDPLAVLLQIGLAGGVISTCFDEVNRWYPAGPLTGTMPWTKQCNEIVTGPGTNQKYTSYFNVTLRNASGKAWVDHIRIHELGEKKE